MAALDPGPGCDGLLFRIARDDIEKETEVLWRREQIGPAYKAVFVDADLPDRRIEALTFVADHGARLIDPHLTREQQIRYVATGTGFAGTSIDYLRNIRAKFAALGINDAEVASLLHDAEAYLRSG